MIAHGFNHKIVAFFNPERKTYNLPPWPWGHLPLIIVN